MRDDEWLENRFEYIQRGYFSDINIPNTLVIKFGRKAKTRLGSIKKLKSIGLINHLKRDFDTEIIITGYFKNPKIPEYVIDATIGHELSHYAQGFSSPLPQLARHPHKGGLVTVEMKKRGMGKLLKKQKKWIKDNWKNFDKLDD